MNLTESIDLLLLTIDNILDNLLQCNSIIEARLLLEQSTKPIKNVRNQLESVKSSTLYEVKTNLEADVKDENIDEYDNFAPENEEKLDVNNSSKPVKILFLRSEKLTNQRQNSKGYRKCGICSSYVKSSDLSQHDLSSHMMDNQYICELCDFKSERRNDTVTHVNENHRPFYRCTHCDDKFNIIQDLKLHLENIHDEVFEDFNCYFCEKKYKSSPELTYHIKTVHDSRRDKCYICNKMFIKRSHLRKHMEIHNSERQSFTCDICGSKFLHKNSLELHIGSDHATKDPEIPCPHCDKMFHTKAHLTKHYQHAHAVKKYLCNICDFKAVNKTRLNIHLESHNETKEHPCSMCSLMFKHMKSLKKHELEVHLKRDVRNFKCSYCGKLFKRKSALKDHVRLHTGDWAATCKICDKPFAQLSNYKLHMRKSHGLEEK